MRVICLVQVQDIGLVFGAAYTILDVRELDQLQLIKLRNPPGDHEVKGAVAAGACRRNECG